MFSITVESGDIRVKNENVNVLFRNLREAQFGAIYSKIVACLPFNFLPVVVAGKSYSLTPAEQACLVQQTATGILYFYTANNLPFTTDGIGLQQATVVDGVIAILDKKFRLRNQDTPKSLALGTHLLGQSLEDYCKTVAGRRRYYDR